MDFRFVGRSVGWSDRCGFSQLGVNPTAGDLVPEELFPYNTVDSSSCIACHTDETVIAASDWGKDKPVAVNTGG
jgi:hypothetical protein